MNKSKGQRRKKPRLPRAPLPRQTGGVHRDKRLKRSHKRRLSLDEIIDIWGA